MKQDLARGRPLQCIADFALGGTAGLLGMLLLGATMVHLLAPVAVRTPDVEPAAFVTTVGSLPKPPIRMSGVAEARRANSHAGSGSIRAAHRSGAKRAEPPHERRREPARPARTLQPAPPAAHVLRPAPVAAHAALRGVLRIVHVTHSAPMAAHVARAAPAVARRHSPHGVAQVARLLRGGGGDAGARTTISRPRFSATAMQPPLGYNVRASLARVPIDALPSAPVATTPVRGRVPPSSPSTAALERRQDVAQPSPSAGI